MANKLMEFAQKAARANKKKKHEATISGTKAAAVAVAKKKTSVSTSSSPSLKTRSASYHHEKAKETSNSIKSSKLGSAFTKGAKQNALGITVTANKLASKAKDQARVQNPMYDRVYNPITGRYQGKKTATEISATKKDLTARQERFTKSTNTELTKVNNQIEKDMQGMTSKQKLAYQASSALGGMAVDAVPSLLLPGAGLAGVAGKAVSSAGEKVLASAGEKAISKIGTKVVGTGIKKAGKLIASGGDAYLTTMGVSAWGTGYDQAVKAGATEDEALNYATGNAAIQVLFEKLSSVGSVFKRLAGTGMIDAESLVNKGINSLLKDKQMGNLAQFLVRSGTAATVEGAEELLAGIAEPILRKATYQKEPLDWKSEIASAWQQFEVGAVLGGVLGGPGAAVNIKQTNAVGDMYSDPETISALIDTGLNLSENTRAYKLAESAATQINGGITPSRRQLVNLAAANQEAIQNEQAQEEQTKASTNRTIERTVGKEYVKPASNIEEELQYHKTAIEVDAGIDMPATVQEYEKIKESVSKIMAEEIQSGRESENGAESDVSSISKILIGEGTSIDFVKLNPGNDTARAVFEKETGKTLPATNAETRSFLLNYNENMRVVAANMEKNPSSLYVRDNAIRAFRRAGEMKLPIESVKEYGTVLSEAEQQRAYESGQNKTVEKEVKAKTQEPKKNRSTVRTESDYGLFDETSTKQKSDIYDAVDKFAKRMKFKVIVRDSIKSADGKAANGYYENGVIVIAKNSTLPFDKVFSHELWHHLKQVSPKNADALESFVKKEFFGNDAIKFDNEMKRLEKLYGKNEDEYLFEEFMSDHVHELLSDPTLAQKLATENKGLAQAIIDFINQFIDSIKAIFGDTNSGDFFAQLGIKEEAVQMLADTIKGIDTKAEVKTENAKPKYQMVGRDEDGIVTLRENPQKINKTPHSSQPIYKSKQGVFKTGAALSDVNISPLDKNVKRFSLSEPVEMKDGLIAVHNLSADALKEALELRGLAMPSIAITLSDLGHDDFGEISMLFGKNTIDPAKSGNNVYSGDAYTPTFPTIGYKLNQDKLKGIRDRLTGTGYFSDTGSDDPFRIKSFLNEENMKNDIPVGAQTAFGAVKNRAGVKAAFLHEKNIPYENVYREKSYYNDSDVLSETLNKYGIDAIKSWRKMDYQALNDNGIIEGLRKTLNEEYHKRYPDIKTMFEDKDFGFGKFDSVVNEIIEYSKEGKKAELDQYATEKNIDAAFNGHEAEYDSWGETLFDGTISMRGIRNPKVDLFTPSGNRRPFERLYLEYTLDNIVKSMKAEPEKGNSFIHGAGGFSGASKSKFKNINAIRNEIGRLKEADTEQLFEIKNDIMVSMSAIAQRMAKNPSGYDDALATITESIRSNPTIGGIKRYISQWPDVFNVNDETASEIFELYQTVTSLPTRYFEAKPRRAVYLDEIMLVVMPNGTDAKLVSGLKDNNIPVDFYDPDIEGDRIAKVNSHDEVRWSLQDSEGVVLTKGQQEYFKDSKVRDEKGRLLRVYHGTPYWNFYSFNGDKYFFSRDWKFAQQYAEDKSFNQGLDAEPRVIESYLNLINPFNPGNVNHLSALKKLLPKKIGYGFGGKKFTQNEYIDRISGKLSTEPLWTSGQIKNAKYGEYIGQARTGYNNDVFVGIDGNNNVVHVSNINRELLPTLSESQKQELISGNSIDITVKYAQVDGPGPLVPVQIDEYNKLKEDGRIYWDSFKRETKTIYPRKESQEVQYTTGNDNWTYFELVSPSVIDIIQSMGHDGIFMQEKGSENYVAFNSNQIKSVDNQNPTEDDDIRYQLQEQHDTDKLRIRNKIDELKTLLSQEKLSEQGKLPNQLAMSKLVKQLRADYNSQISINKPGGLVDQLTQIYVLLKSKGDNLEAVYEKSHNLAKDIISQGGEMQTETEREYKALKEYMHKTPLKIMDEHKGDFGRGDFEKFRRSMFGKLKLSKDGQTMDSIYPEMLELFPELLNKEVTHPTDQLTHVLDVMEELKPVFDTYDIGSEAGTEMVDMVTLDILDAMFGMDPQKPMTANARRTKYQNILESIEKSTNEYADKTEQQKVEDKAKYEKMLSEIEVSEANRRIEQKKAYERLTAELKSERDELIKLTKLIGEAKLKKQEEIFRKRLENTKARFYENRSRGEMMDSIKRNADFLAEALVNPTDTKHIPEGYRRAVAEMLSGLDFESTHTDAWEKRMGAPGKRIMKLRKLAQQYESILDGKEEAFAEFDEEMRPLIRTLSDTLDDEDGGKRLSELNNDELNNVRVILQHLRHVISNANKTLNDNIKESISELGEKAIAEASRVETSRGWNNALQSFGSMMLSDFADAPHFFTRMGGTMEKMYSEIREGWDKDKDNLTKAMAFIDSAKSKYDITNKDIDSWSQKRGDAKTFKLSSGHVVELLPSQVMSIYGLMLREQARGHIFGSGFVVKDLKAKHLDQSEADKKKTFNIFKNKLMKTHAKNLTQEDINKIISSLSDKQISLVKDAVHYMSTTGADLGNETSMKLYGYKKYTEPNYFPIQTAKEFLNNDINSKEFVSKIKNAPSTKSIVPDANNPIVIDDFFDVFTKHITWMSSYNSFVPALTDFEKVFNYKQRQNGMQTTSVQDAIDRRYGKKAIAFISNLVRDINGNSTHDYGYAIWEKGLSNFKKGTLGFNLRVLMQQPTAAFRTLILLNPKYLAKGISMKLSKKSTRKEMWENIPTARYKSWGFAQTDVSRGSVDIMWGRDNPLNKITMGMYGFADDISWSIIYGAVKAEAKDKMPELKYGTTEYVDHIRKRFNEIVDLTQVVDSSLHRTQIMRDKTLFPKIATSFMAENMKTFNIYVTQMIKFMQAKSEGNTSEAAKSMAIIPYAMISTTIFLAIMQSIPDALRRSWTGGDDDDDKSYWELFIEHFKDNFVDDIMPFNMVPFFRDIYSISKGYDATTLPSLNTIQRLIDDIGMFGKYISKSLNGEESSRPMNYILRKISEDLALLAGVPLKNANREVESLYYLGWSLGGYSKYSIYLKNKSQYKVSQNEAKFIDIYLKAAVSGNSEDAKMIYDDLKKEGVTEKAIINRIKNNYKDVLKQSIEDGLTTTATQTIDQMVAMGMPRDAIEGTVTSNVRDGYKAAFESQDRAKIEKYNSLLKAAGFSDEDIAEYEQGMAMGYGKFQVYNILQTEGEDAAYQEALYWTELYPAMYARGAEGMMYGIERSADSTKSDWEEGKWRKEDFDKFE